MAFLTKEECVRRHRLLWNYIADQIEEQEEVPWDCKEEAFEHFGWHNGDMFNYCWFNYCWACYYRQMKDFEMVDDADAEKRKGWLNCHNCLFDWHNHGDKPWDDSYSNYCDDGTTLYSHFHALKLNNDNWKKAARIAREIANMPVRDGV